MFRFVVFAAALSAVAVGSASYLSEMVSSPRADLPIVAATVAVVAPTGREVALEADPRGHFPVEAVIGPGRLAMLVDTGATLVALRESDARLAGIFVTPGDFTLEVSTANGTLSAAPVTLREIGVGDIRLNDVEAIVLPDRALAGSLLGMSFLRRLSRFEADGERLVLVE
jgi:aspartyl protease family protein